MRFLPWTVLLPMAFAASPERVDLCHVLDEPGKYAGKIVELQGSIKPLMHGTYLNQAGCDRALLLPSVSGGKPRASPENQGNLQKGLDFAHGGDLIVAADDNPEGALSLDKVERECFGGNRLKGTEPRSIGVGSITH
jgi:hypothetical protein